MTATAPTPARRIDLNADLGESFGRWTLGDDAGLLDLITSANVACGFHAGDPSVMRATCEAAASRGVAIGAQVGYPDLAGFGRRFIDVEPDRLADDVLYQIGALSAFARAAGTEVTYVKPHGALYTAIVAHEAQATAVAIGVAQFAPGLPVLGLPGSAWLRAAGAAGLRPVAEAFADRGYTPTGELVSRRLPGALLHDPVEVADRVVRMVLDHQVRAVDGTTVPLHPQSVCVHGDTTGAVALAGHVRSALATAGIEVALFTAATAGSISRAVPASADSPG
jgi:UPF0271 protein